MKNLSLCAEKLKKEFVAKKARVGVVGLGYVGLPLAVEMAKAGFYVTGIDTDPERVRKINSGISYILDISSETLSRYVSSGLISATSDYHAVEHLDAISICVPTPLRKTKDPDISYIVEAIKGIAQYKHEGQLVILESTTYPGTTEEILLPALETPDFRVGEHFFLAFSPERVDPGNKQYATYNTPKIIGGVTPTCTEVAQIFYQQFIKKVIIVSSTQAAEMVKLLENTFRSVNIALVNEMALMCDRLDCDIWEIIDAAATKPFGFMPFYPGPGLGGHCIPIDPHYLSWKLKSLNYEARFIELAASINSSMPHYVLSKIIDALNDRAMCVKKSRVLILGVAYKRDINDVRESPALDIIQLLRDRGAELSYNDPYVSELITGTGIMKSTPITAENLRSYDLGVIITDHSCYDYPFLLTHLPLLLDTRNATVHTTGFRDKIIKL